LLVSEPWSCGDAEELEAAATHGMLPSSIDWHSPSLYNARKLSVQPSSRTHRLGGRKVKGHRAVIPFNGIDKALLCWDSSDQHMTYHAILSIEGEIDAGRLNQALLRALLHHPTLRTNLRSTPFRHFREVQDDCDGWGLEVRDLVDLQTSKGSADAQVCAEYEERLSQWINRPPNLEREFPLRALLLRKKKGESSLVLTFHHSAIDGVRAARFVDELISRYNDNDPAESSLSDDVRIHHRGDELMELARSERPGRKHFYRQMVSHLLHFVFIYPLSHPTKIFHNRSGSSEAISFCSGKLGPAEFQQMKSKANSVGGTVNDILAAACFISIEKWNAMHGKKSRKISAMVPVDIGPGERQHIASNQISYVPVSSMPKDRSDSTKLLRSVRGKTAHVLREARGKTFSIVCFAYFYSRLPLPIMSALGKFILFPLYADSILLTNVGIIRLGNDGEGEMEKGRSRIVDLTPVAFVLKPMGMSVVISTYNNDLGIHLTYRTSYFSKEEAAQFLDLYLDETRDYQVSPEAG
jgi:NRPS condensation-like uncharacterized protein